MRKIYFYFKTSFANHQLRSAVILRSGGVLLHIGAEDEHVEGGSWLGESLDIHLCPLVSGCHGGTPDSSGGAEEAQS